MYIAQWLGNSEFERLWTEYVVGAFRVSLWYTPAEVRKAIAARQEQTVSR